MREKKMRLLFVMSSNQKREKQNEKIWLIKIIQTINIQKYFCLLKIYFLKNKTQHYEDLPLKKLKILQIILNS